MRFFPLVEKAHGDVNTTYGGSPTLTVDGRADGLHVVNDTAVDLYLSTDGSTDHLFVPDQKEVQLTFPTSKEHELEIYLRKSASTVAGSFAVASWER